MVRVHFSVLACMILISAIATAQGLCPAGATNDKLICLIPDVYETTGIKVHLTPIFGAPVPDTFQDVTSNNLRPLNSAIARQSGLLPLASPSSGITFTWSAAAKALVPSTDSYGPILGERAETIGKYRVFLGFSYQYFNFDDLDGNKLKTIPTTFLQADTNGSSSPPICSLNGVNDGDCGFIRDAIKTVNRVDLKVHQFTTFITFGLTDRIDLSAAIPISDVRMNVVSNATIINNLDSSNTIFAHTFDLRSGCGTAGPPPKPCLTQSFVGTRSASGIGDITLRVKGTAWKGEHAGLGLGVDVRVPSGDSLNFLGAGAAGVRPFIVWSYRSRVSPHVSVGYEVNGSSKNAGDITIGSKERLPSQLTYVGGADVWITKRITGAFDLLGQQVFQARRLARTTVTEPAACIDPTGQCGTGNFATPVVDPSVADSTGTYNATSASLGIKFRPFANLLVTGNVLVRLNDGGLGGRTTPLIGVSYTF